MENDRANPLWAMRSLPNHRLRWNRQCPHCHVTLLTNETPGFCCGRNGSRLGDVVPLPPLPAEYIAFVNSPDISPASRILNLTFSFAALESTAEFPATRGPPGFFAIQGRIYHRLRPNHQNSGIRWLLHDGYMRDRAPFPQWIDSLPPAWTTAMANSLLRVNPLARHLHHLHLLLPDNFPNAQIDLRDEGTAEIAAIMVYDNTALGDVAPRTLVISRRDGVERSVPTTSRLWEPLAYPLLFPQGTLGWGVVGGENGDLRRELEQLDDNVDAPTSLIWHTRARLLREPRFEIFGRLTCEYVVDQWTRELDCRLNYIALNQARIRQQDAELMGVDRVPDSENIFLPASFLGSRRWCSERAAEALAVAASLGVPTFFITFTCSTDWPEITDRLRGNQTFADIPVIVARVFKQKLAQLLAILENLFPNAGKPVYIMHSVEFQKRGLPHAHILVKYNLECVTAEDIDAVISAELPEDPSDRELVRKLMLHKHPRPEQPPSTYCQRETDAGMRSCRFGYPKALQAVTTVDNEGRVQYRRRNPGDEIVVPYCLPLLKRFGCHINFECANTSTIFQYLFKYIHKGPDRARFRVGIGPGAEPINELEDFVAGRYLSAGEATWRILGFHITRKQPAVSTLPVHLPDTNLHHQYHRRDGAQSTMSLLGRYFCRPQGQYVLNGQAHLFADLSYTEYYRFFRLLKYNPTLLQRPGHFVEDGTPEGEIVMMVVQRTHSNDHVARIQPVPPSQGERFYLRSILIHRPVTSFLDARTVDGRVYQTYQEAAAALGIFADQNEAEYAIQEAITAARTPASLRFLFVHLLVNDCCPAPLVIWDTFKLHFIQDHYVQNNMVEDLATDLALHDIGRYLEEYHKTLADYGLPNPVQRVPEVLYELRRWGPHVPLMERRAEEAERSFNPEQRAIYDEVITAVIQQRPLLLFVDGKAGRGKTFLVNAICDRLRGMGKVVIATATSASAAQLYPGGRTAHSAFKIPVNDRSELLESPIEPGSPAAELLVAASVLIWDEAPMANKATLACTENLLRTITGRADVPFGGKILILLGDFRQTCPVIQHGSRAQVVEASIRSSHLWPLFQIRRLITPIRNAADLEYAAFVDAIGDGAGPEVDLDLLPTTNEADAIVDFVYPAEVLTAPEACLTRSILAPTHVQVNKYNADIKNRLEGMDRTYLAADTLKEADDLDLEPDQAILDFVARHTPSGLPDAHLVLRKGAIVRLMRNFSIERGLVKNMRAVVADVGHRLVTIRRLVAAGGVNRVDEELILIPRITFCHPLPSGHTLQRRQFPLALGYATTFNSCQGLTLDRMGIDLTRPVFSHGQLYTALSRIKLRGHGVGLLPLGQSRVLNVTYPEILI